MSYRPQTPDNNSYMIEMGDKYSHETSSTGGLLGYDDHTHWRDSDIDRVARSRFVTYFNRLVLFISILSILVFLYESRKPLGSLGDNPPHRLDSDSHQQKLNDSIGQILHPSDHIYRPPTTLYYKWRISTGHRRPDGVLKRVYLVNDDVHHLIEARSGDRLIIHVENAIENGEETVLHWHGLSMRGGNQFDGAVGITQDPIHSGESFVYNFTIAEDEHGTFWWHAHSQTQRADGLFGGLIVHAPVFEDKNALVNSQPEVSEEQLLLVGDWYHRSASDVLAWYMRAGSFGNEPVPDSLVLNGHGAYSCSDAVPARPLDCEQRQQIGLYISHNTRLRIINTGSLAALKIRTPGNLMKPLTVDGGIEVEGSDIRVSEVGTLWPGQRLDVMLASGQAGLFEIEMSRENFKYVNPALSFDHTFPLEWSPVSEFVATKASTTNTLNLKHLTPASSVALAPKAEQTIVLYSLTQKLSHLRNIPHGFVNNTYWTPQSPPLISLNRTDYDEHQLVPFIRRNTTVDIVLNNLDEDSHPFHLHGYNFYILGTYSTTFSWGSWNPYETEESPGGPLNLQTPIKRDTVYVPRRGYAVLRLTADNPGVWMFHCHVLWHQNSGMAMAIEVG